MREVLREALWASSVGREAIWSAHKRVWSSSKREAKGGIWGYACVGHAGRACFIL